MYIIYSSISVEISSVASIVIGQICRFDYFVCGKFGSLRNLNIIALKSATKPYMYRLALAKK